VFVNFQQDGSGQASRGRTTGKGSAIAEQGLRTWRRGLLQNRRNPQMIIFFRLRFPLILLALVPWLLSCHGPAPPFSCTDPLGCVDIRPGQPVTIGILQAMSGDVATLGQEQIRGIELAVDDRQGTVLGSPLALVTEDCGCSEEGGANAVLKLIANPQTVAILGTTCSASAKTASAAMSKAGLTMVSGNNSAPYLTSIGGKAAPYYHPGYFRTAPNEEFSGMAAAVFAYQELGIRKAATINDGDIYTRGLTDGFSKKFKSLGGEIVLAATINKGDGQMKPVLAAVKAAKADLLFFPLFEPEGDILLLEAKKDRELDGVVLMSDGSLIQQSFLETVRDKGKGLYFVGPYFPRNQETAALTEKYQKKYHQQPATDYFLSAYDSAALLFKAMEQAAVRENDGTLHIGRQALRDAMHAIADFPGISGRLTCDAFGDCGYPAFNILRLDDPNAGLQGLLANIIFFYSPK
jgi:branched-chain amino acid transport system substrate-binding protein